MRLVIVYLLVSSLLLCIFNLNSFASDIMITYEDVHCSIRNVKFTREMYVMPMFIIAVCVLFLLIVRSFKNVLCFATCREFCSQAKCKRRVLKGKRDNWDLPVFGLGIKDLGHWDWE